MNILEKRCWRTLLLAMVGAALMVYGSCAPVVTRFVPETGNVGSDVTIKGKRFGESAGENTVKFGGVTATTVSTPEPGTLIATVPPGAKTGMISVTTDEGTGFSDHNFRIAGTKWTFMIYMDGDNNLEGAALDDFLEAAAVGSTSDVNIVVQIDRVPGHSSTYGDWTGTRRYLIGKGNTPATPPISDLGEENMGDPAVLEDFVEWAISNYPAERYALSIWNHGGGWRTLQERLAAAAMARGDDQASMARAVAWDDTDNDVLYMREVQTALANAKSNLETRYGTVVKLDVVGFDACLMGMVEVAYALRSVADFVVASEETEPFDGWPYDTIFGDLTATPSMDASDLAGTIVTRYYQSYPQGSGITQSAIDVAEIQSLAASIDAFTRVAVSDWAQIAEARAYTLAYHPWGNSYWGVDLRDFADEVYVRSNTATIKTAALALREAVDATIVNELHSTDMVGSHGIAIYFPPTQSAFQNDPDHSGYEQSNSFMTVDFVAQHQWDEWLQDYYSNIP